MDAKPKKKRGCLYAFLIGVAVLMGFIIYAIVLINQMADIYGVSLKVFNEYMDLLKKPVNESVLAPSPILAEDFNTFKLKANSKGFEIFDDNGNVNLELFTIKLKEDLSLTDKQVGAMLNNGFNKSSDYKAIDILQLNFSDGRISKLNSVIKYDFSELKNTLGGFVKELPNYIYLTCESEVVTAGSRIFVTDSKTKINQLSDDENKKLTELLDLMLAGSTSEIKFNNVNNTLITNVLTDIARASNCNVSVSQNSFSLSLIKSAA